MLNANDAIDALTGKAPNVADPERWISVIVGTALAGYGLSRRGSAGWVAALAGGALVWRGATGHCPVYGSLGISTVPDEDGRNVSVPYGKGFRVEKSTIVSAAPEQVYAFWRNVENLPRFLDHLESVEVLDSRRSRWIAKGPAGMNAQWEAEIINEVPGELIGWRSVEKSNVNHAGSVHFTPTGGGGTEVRVILRYDPPAGAAGAAFARLFGEDPATQIEEDLGRLRDLFAGGATPRPLTPRASAGREESRA